ncbi:hypothetical protein SELR_06550 [Selenomonas ruminantium subsp. lactilytica TAM6421]|uniref:Nucleotidyltransferase substrate binding protein, HI0074 family n=1 Tax=Selenomonas ruminantium subsp. lactilytica (strain NBRC 103574 / TAM6421) TaxID=927704 RepID=I0GNM6_SELRL|nr:hypothetical protein SELR_06550 [Selenomonas ruminantium subsp. lactilytica TAM6421]
MERLHEAVSKDNLSEIERDGLIQRFEFCFEIMWKCGKDYLYDHEGLDVASPKKVIRCLREVGIFSDVETEQALKMVDDRNLTAHTYDEEMAKELAERIYVYESLLQAWYSKMVNQKYELGPGMEDPSMVKISQ